MNQKRIYEMVITAMLIAVGIVIPSFMPKIVIEPMSFTLASHTAIMIAMFISPTSAALVALGTTLGFLLTGLPIVIVLRALSHVVWAYVGALYLFKNKEIVNQPINFFIYNLAVGILHGLLEVIISSIMYFSNALAPAIYESSFMYSILLLVGIGTIVHSMVDFYIAWFVNKAINPITKKIK